MILTLDSNKNTPNIWEIKQNTSYVTTLELYFRHQSI